MTNFSTDQHFAWLTFQLFLFAKGQLSNLEKVMDDPRNNDVWDTYLKQLDMFKKFGKADRLKFMEFSKKSLF